MEASLGSFRNPIKFKDQDFNSLLEKCLKSGEMFSDQTFPAEQKSIGMAEDDDPRKAIKWKRPKVDQTDLTSFLFQCVQHNKLIAFIHLSDSHNMVCSLSLK